MARHGIERVPVIEIYSDFDRNFRDPILEYADCQPTVGYDHAEYLKGNIKQGFFEDLFYNGVTTPIWVSALTVDQIESIYQKTGRRHTKRTLRGHRRMYTVNLINSLFPDHIKEVDCDVYYGLSFEQEWELMADHSPTKREQPLSELGLYRAVVNLHGAGLGQEKIANMMGQKRGWSMRRIWLHQMGVNTPVEQDFLAQFDPKREKGTYVSIPISKVDSLHVEYSKDTDSGRDPMAEGSSFREKYESFRDTGNTSKPEPKSQPRKAITERMSFVKGRPALEEAMKFASNDGGNLNEAAKMYDRLATKAALADTLTTELESVKAELATVKTELDTVKAESDTLRTELETVRGELKTARESKPVGKPAGKVK